MTDIELKLIEVLLTPKIKDYKTTIKRLEEENQELKDQNKKLLDKILHCG